MNKQECIRAINDDRDVSFDLIREVYENAKVVKSGKHLTTVNELCDQVPSLRPATLRAAMDLALRHGTFGANKILSEEDKGAPIAAACALETNLPLCMARWYTYDLPDQIKVEIKSEYFSGALFLNGIRPNDRVLIIDDTLSTGGTMISMIEAVQKAGAHVVGAVAVVEKVENKGREIVWDKTGIDVKTHVKIVVSEEGVTVL